MMNNWYVPFFDADVFGVEDELELLRLLRRNNPVK